MARTVRWLPRSVFNIQPDATQFLGTQIVGSAGPGVTPIRSIVRIQLLQLTSSRSPNHRRLQEDVAMVGLYWNGDLDDPTEFVFPASTPDAVDWMWWESLTWQADWEPNYKGGFPHLWAYKAETTFDVNVSRGPFTSDAQELRLAWEVVSPALDTWVGVYGTATVLARDTV